MNKDLINQVIGKLISEGVDLGEYEKCCEILSETVAPGLNLKTYNFIYFNLFKDPTS